jgi:hypothetical protein
VLLFDILALLAIWSAAPAAPPPAALGPELAAIRAAARDQGNRIWPSFGEAPFSFLLLEPGGETLLCRPTAPPGFNDAGLDAATGCPRFVRPRGTMPDNWLAAMPLFGPPSTIVMGTPASTGLTRPRWRSTVLHEHVHQ